MNKNSINKTSVIGIYKLKVFLNIVISIQLDGKDIIETVIPKDCNMWSEQYADLWHANNNKRMQSICDFLNSNGKYVDIIASLNEEINKLNSELEKKEEALTLLRQAV